VTFDFNVLSRYYSAKPQQVIASCWQRSWQPLARHRLSLTRHQQLQLAKITSAKLKFRWTYTESVEIPDMPELGTYVIELCRDSTADNCVFFSMLGATDVISSVPFEDNLETDNGNGEEYIPDVEDELETYDSSDEEYVPANDEHRSDNVL